jgi:quercetin dioxygenase-like cupin family protein
VSHLQGSGIVGAVNEQGQNYLAEVNEGDLWYFPAGVPHYIQASNHTVGCEFLLVFDDGNFNEDSTFLLTDWTGR